MPRRRAIARFPAAPPINTRTWRSRPVNSGAPAGSPGTEPTPALALMCGSIPASRASCVVKADTPPPWSATNSAPPTLIHLFASGKENAEPQAAYPTPVAPPAPISQQTKGGCLKYWPNFTHPETLHCFAANRSAVFRLPQRGRKPGPVDQKLPAFARCPEVSPHAAATAPARTAGEPAGVQHARWRGCWSQTSRRTASSC